jgi:hypothetical protein
MIIALSKLSQNKSPVNIRSPQVDRLNFSHFLASAICAGAPDSD